MEEKRYLGIDWGEVRVGLSIGDNILKIATPLDVVSGLEQVREYIEKEHIDEVVLGEPRKMNAENKNFHNDFLDFKEGLKRGTDKKIIIIDERLSSKAADALVGDKKNKAPRDAVAAMIILQTYLDQIN